MYATTYEWATSGPSDEYTISDTGTVSSEGAITSQSVEASHGSRRALAGFRRDQLKRVGSSW